MFAALQMIQHLACDQRLENVLKSLEEHSDVAIC